MASSTITFQFFEFILIKIPIYYIFLFRGLFFLILKKNKKDFFNPKKEQKRFF